MNVACGACPAKYVIPDEKVKGRKVRIPCKHCGAAIIIDGTTAVSGVTDGPSKAPSAGSIQPGVEAKGAAAASPPQAMMGTDTAMPVAEAPKPIAEAPKPTPNNPSPAVEVAKPIARPVQRNIRQTIIGVAAPANAPDSAPIQPPLRRPTPIYVRAAGVSPLDAQGSLAEQPQPSSHASGQMRSIRRTMLGGLDADTPASDPAAAGQPQKRNIKQTIIGGLEAPGGNSEQSPKRPRPSQETPPGTWLAALPDGKTLKIAERDLPRAVKRAYISMETPLWHAGMSDWLPLEQIPELLSLVNKSATLPQALNQEASQATEIPSPERAISGASLPKVSAKPPANEPKRPPLPFAAPGLGPSKVPAPRPTSTSTSRQPAVPRMSGTPAPVAKLPSLSPARTENAGFSATKPQVSRGPASVSARSSSPTLELMVLDNDAEIAGIVAAETESTVPREPVAEVEAAPTAPTNPMDRASSGAFGVVPGSSRAVSVATSSIPSAATTRDTMPGSRSRRSRAPMAALVTLLIVAALLVSYITRQPRPLYEFLRAHGWEQSLDRTVQPLVMKTKVLLHL